jgi:hypothetical protein
VEVPVVNEDVLLAPAGAVVGGNPAPSRADCVDVCRLRAVPPMGVILAALLTRGVVRTFVLSSFSRSTSVSIRVTSLGVCRGDAVKGADGDMGPIVIASGPEGVEDAVFIFGASVLDAAFHTFTCRSKSYPMLLGSLALALPCMGPSFHTRS